MINVSNEYRQVLGGNDRRFYADVEIKLRDNTVLNLDNSNILDIKIDDASTPEGQFTIGSAIINQLTLQINNLYDEFSDYDFTDAIIRPSVGLQLSETIETVQKGVFIADDPKAIGSVINLIALDNMSKFDRPFSEIAQAFPCTIRDLLITVCTHCGVHLATTTFYNDDYIIQERPDDEAISCREIVLWISQIAVSFAKTNNQGSLELRWYDTPVLEDSYDGGIFDSDTPYSTGDDVDGGTFAFNDGDDIDGGTFEDLKKFHHIYSMYSNLNVAIDDVVITGISVSDPVITENKVVYGESGYLISIEGNKLIQTEIQAQFVAESIGQKVIGMRFRPFETTTRSDPTIETGDVAKVSDRKGNVYHSIITHYTYSIAKPCRISSDAESPLRNSSTRYSETAKAIIEAQKMVKEEKNARELAIQQLQSALENSSGLYPTVETLPDNSKIYYFHDKPTIAESEIVWKITAEAFGVSVDGGATYPTGITATGDAILQRLYAIDVDAKLLTTGKITSTDGATLIDMAYGVANSDNFSYIDNVQSGFPLVMPFNIDDSVSKINKVLLKYTQQKFRTYSKTASSGGGSSTTSDSGGSSSQTSSTAGDDIYPTSSSGKHSHQYSAGGGTINLTTGSTLPPSDVAHTHTVQGNASSLTANTLEVSAHSHTITTVSHSHKVNIPSHTHGVNIPSHTHSLDFGIQEKDISSHAMTIHVDGVLRRTIADSPENAQGIIDLTEWITTTGWHEIEIRSATLKRVSAQINIKSYIRS